MANQFLFYFFAGLAVLGGVLVVTILAALWLVRAGERRDQEAARSAA